MINRFLDTVRKLVGRENYGYSLGNTGHHHLTRATIIWGRKNFNFHVVPLFQLDACGIHYRTRKGPFSCFRPEQIFRIVIGLKMLPLNLARRALAFD